MKYCPKCGKELKKENLRFCPECGYTLNLVESTNVQQIKKSRKKNIVKFVVAVFIAVLACGGGYIIYDKYQNNQQGKREIAEIQNNVGQTVKQDQDSSKSPRENVERLNASTYPTNYKEHGIYTKIFTYPKLSKIDISVYKTDDVSLLFTEDDYWKEYEAGNLDSSVLVPKFEQMLTDYYDSQEENHSIDEKEEYPSYLPLPGTYYVDDAHTLIGADGVVGTYTQDEYWNLFVKQGNDARGGQYRVKGGRFTKEQIQGMKIPKEWYPWWAK